MSDWQSFFEEFVNFAPQHTSIMMPMMLGLLCFSLCGLMGNKYNEKKLKQKYHDDSPFREPEQISRLIILIVVAGVASFAVSDLVYVIIDWSANKKWYVYKYWFPKMLS